MSEARAPADCVEDRLAEIVPGSVVVIRVAGKNVDLIQEPFIRGLRQRQFADDQWRMCRTSGTFGFTAGKHFDLDTFTEGGWAKHVVEVSIE